MEYADTLTYAQDKMRVIFDGAIADTWFWQLARRNALRKAKEHMMSHPEDVVRMAQQNMGSTFDITKINMRQWIDLILGILSFLPIFGFIFAIIEIALDFYWDGLPDGPDKGERNETVTRNRRLAHLRMLGIWSERAPDAEGKDLRLLQLRLCRDWKVPVYEL